MGWVPIHRFFLRFFPFRIFIKTSKVWEIWRYRCASRNPREILHILRWWNLENKIFDLFGHFSAYFSLLNHYISSPGTSENHRKTCGKVSWRYGYDPVHITYPSTRNTSENRRSFFPKIRHFSPNFPEKSFAWNGFSGLIREISRIRLENPFQADFICLKWGRKTHFRPIHPHRGSNAGVS